VEQITGILGEASVGGHRGRELRRAGYDGKEGGQRKTCLPYISCLLSTMNTADGMSLGFHGPISLSHWESNPFKEVMWT
jgi:hypothetical protein